MEAGLAPPELSRPAGWRWPYEGKTTSHKGSAYGGNERPATARNHQSFVCINSGATCGAYACMARLLLRHTKEHCIAVLFLSGWSFRCMLLPVINGAPPGAIGTSGRLTQPRRWPHRTGPGG